MRPSSVLRYLFLLTLLVACEVAEPVAVVSEHQVSAGEWLVRFAPTEGTLEFGRTLAGRQPAQVMVRATSVRLVLGRSGHSGRTTLDLPLRHAQRFEDTLVVSCGEQPDHRISVICAPLEDGGFRIEVRDEVALLSQVHELSLLYEIVNTTAADQTWLPHQHAEADQVAGDGSFHTPLAFARHGSQACAWVADWQLLGQQRRIPQAFELDRSRDGDRHLISLRHGLVTQVVGAQPTSGFRRTGASPVAVQGETLRFAHQLLLFDTADSQTLDEVVHSIWERAKGQPQPRVQAFDTTATALFASAAGEHWLDLNRRNTSAGTIRTGRAQLSDQLPGLDAWYEAKQASTRTAYGMLMFAERTAAPELAGKAKQVLAHALSAPTRGGLRPAIFLADASTRDTRWVLDSQSSGDTDHYHALDTATTCYWMLRMVERQPELRQLVHQACSRAARFLRLNQMHSGAFPSYFEKQFLAPRRGRLHSASAETGAVARFLLEYAAASADQDALDAGRRAVAWIQRQAERGLWLDYEAAAAPGADVDQRSGMPRQGTLGLIHCALAVFRLHRLQASPDLVTLGNKLLAQLARYQQVFRPPWLSGTTIGGFGAGNFDHRWNDARQSLAALAFFQGYQATDDPQWLERGVAALRAGLSTGAREYQPARDQPGPVSTLHWGLGTACTITEIVRQQLGQGVIDLSNGLAVGIDSIWFEDLEFNLATGQVRMRVLTHALGLDQVQIRFRRLAKLGSRFSIIVNDQPLGQFDAATLARGITIRPVPVPIIDYRPARTINRHLDWSPRARIRRGELPQRVELEVQTTDGRSVTLPLSWQEAGQLLVLREDFTLPPNTTPGTQLRSRLTFRSGGYVHRVPATGFATTLIGEFDRIDPGEGDELELIDQHGSRLRRFVDGRESARHLAGGSHATYRLPIAEQATHLDFTLRLTGQVRIRTGTVILHEDKLPVPGIRELAFELADHRLWRDDGLDLRIEALDGPDGVDVAWIHYRGRGQVTSTIGLGTTRIRREPDQQLRILVQPASLLDHPLHLDRESLRLAFFGDSDYRRTPPPASKPTAGSVAQYLQAVSGGVTSVTGRVLATAAWNWLAVDLNRPTTQIDASWFRNRPDLAKADVVVVILASKQLPRARTIRIGTRTLPLIFLPARGADGAVLSCGAAATAVLEASYGIQPLRDPEHGNFGTLSLSGPAVTHLPPSPCGINLVKTGWADHLVVQRRTIDKMVLSPLLPGRVNYLLDCSQLPGRGRLFLEMRFAGNGEPPANTGALLYWQFDRARPTLRDLGGRSCRPSILRLSAQRGRLETPHLPGDVADLFRTAATELPAATLTGERVWSLRNFQLLDQGRARLDLQYLATDLLRSPQASWQLDGKPAAGLRRQIERRGRRIRIRLAPHQRLRLNATASAQPTRLFLRILRRRGRAELRIGSTETLAQLRLESGRPTEWLQVDVRPQQPIWLELHNPSDAPASVDLGSFIRVPRVPFLHRIRPTRLPSCQTPELDDGITYADAVCLPVTLNKTSEISVPVVLPAGPVALRLRCGLAKGDSAPAQLSVILRHRDGKQRKVLLDARQIGGDGVFLGLFEIPAAEHDRVEFLDLHWRGANELYLVDLSIIRP